MVKKLLSSIVPFIIIKTPMYLDVQASYQGKTHATTLMSRDWGSTAAGPPQGFHLIPNTSLLDFLGWCHGAYCLEAQLMPEGGDFIVDGNFHLLEVSKLSHSFQLITLDTKIQLNPESGFPSSPRRQCSLIHKPLKCYSSFRFSLSGMCICVS